MHVIKFPGSVNIELRNFTIGVCHDIALLASFLIMIHVGMCYFGVLIAGIMLHDLLSGRHGSSFSWSGH